MPAKKRIITVNHDTLTQDQFNSLCNNKLKKLSRINILITMLEKAKDKKKLINDFYLCAFQQVDKDIELKQAIKDLLIPASADEARSILILLQLLIDPRSSHTPNPYQLDFVNGIANHIAQHVIHANYLDLFASRFLKMVVDKTISHSNKQYFDAIFPLIAKSKKVSISILSPSLLSRVFNRSLPIENIITPSQLIELVENNPTKDFIKTFIVKRPLWDFLGLFYKGYGKLFSREHWEEFLTSPKLASVRTELLNAVKSYCSKSLYAEFEKIAVNSKNIVKVNRYNLSSVSSRMGDAVEQVESQQNDINSANSNSDQTEIRQTARRRSYSASDAHSQKEVSIAIDTWTGHSEGGSPINNAAPTAIEWPDIAFDAVTPTNEKGNRLVDLFPPAFPSQSKQSQKNMVDQPTLSVNETFAPAPPKKLKLIDIFSPPSEKEVDSQNTDQTAAKPHMRAKL